MKQNKIKPRDPIAAFQRKATSSRAIGNGRSCPCGEARPEALIRGSEPTICAKCDRDKKGKSSTDDHHVSGQNNDPNTLPTPVNDHRATLTVAQQDWPQQTLENRDRCPLLRGAACVRGVIDYLHYLIDKFLAWIPEMLEMLSTMLNDALGGQWWVGTPLQKFAPGE
jgi:hypothetical protein